MCIRDSPNLSHNRPVNVVSCTAVARLCSYKRNGDTRHRARRGDGTTADDELLATLASGRTSNRSLTSAHLANQPTNCYLGQVHLGTVDIRVLRSEPCDGPREMPSVRFVRGDGGFNPHWLKMTPTLVTENFCLGSRRGRRKGGKREGKREGRGGEGPH